MPGVVNNFAGFVFVVLLCGLVQLAVILVQAARQRRRRPVARAPIPGTPRPVGHAAVAITTGRARWLQRVLRFWLIVLLPLAGYAAYSARESHQELPFWNDQRVKWDARLNIVDSAGGSMSPEATDARQRFKTALDEIQALEERRDCLTQIALGLSLFPLFAWVTSHAIVWVWRGSHS